MSIVAHMAALYSVLFASNEVGADESVPSSCIQ